MRKFAFLFCLFCVFSIISLNAEAAAASVKIISGEIIFGGTSYGSPDYQTYARISINAKRQNPQRNYTMSALQAYSVFLDHPIQPNGNFQYDIVMPYGPQSLSVNGVSFYPVFFEDCKWTIHSSAITPKATPESPQFVTVTSPFILNGVTILSGANNSNFKLSGSGTVNIIFEKVRPDSYYFREAKYTFIENSQANIESK